MNWAALGHFLSSLDRWRRQQGEALDRLGYGAQTTASRTATTTRSARLLAYQRPARDRPAILLVPAPIKTSYIWDLAPRASVVQQCLRAGLQAYLVDWSAPRAGDESLGLDEYAGRAIARCADAICAETHRSRMFIAGHSLGGTLAAIHASLEPDRLAGLIALEAPIEFGSGVLEAAMRAAPSAKSITKALGNAPGSLLTCASVAADPTTFGAEPAWDVVASSASPDARRLHAQVRRWSFDETPMAARLYEQVVDEIYRGNRFAERRLRVCGALADPRAIDMPVLAVANPRSRVVPRASIDAYRARTRSGDVQIFHYRGDSGVMLQHVGVLVGDSAHRTLWPRIVRWIERRA